MADMYEDGPDQAAAANSSATETKPEEKPSEAKTALIDSSICPGMKAGDSMVLKIEKVLDKEYLCSYDAGDKEKEESTSKPADAESAQSPGESQAGSMYE